MFECNICQKYFASRQSMKTHEQIHVKRKIFVCGECKKSFMHFKNLKEHIVVHSSDHAKEGTQENLQNTLQTDLSPNKSDGSWKKQYTCDECGRGFSRNSALLKHQADHTRERKYKCDSCGKKFSQYNQLTKHQLQHNKEEIFECKMCEEWYSCKSALSKHEQEHNAEKTYKCEECDQSFSRNSALVKHKNDHHTEKKFRCGECDKVFNCNSSIMQHMKGHCTHPCDLCSKSFTSKELLLRHMASHSSVDKSSLQALKVSDNTEKNAVEGGEKNHECKECGKRFRLLGEFSRHKVTHLKQIGNKSDKHQQSFTQNIAHLSSKKTQGENSTLLSPRKTHIENSTQLSGSKTQVENTGKLSHKKTKVENTSQVSYTKIQKENSGKVSHKKTKVENTSQVSYTKIQNETSGKLSHKKAKVEKSSHLSYKKTQVENSSKLSHNTTKVEKNSYMSYKKPQVENNSKLSHKKTKVENSSHSSHKKTHVENSAQLSQKKAQTKSSIKSTQGKTHGSQKNYTCEDCDTHFEKLSSLKEHSLVHNIKKFECKECGRTYKHKRSLDHHYWVHVIDEEYGFLKSKEGKPVQDTTVLYPSKVGFNKKRGNTAPNGAIIVQKQSRKRKRCDIIKANSPIERKQESGSYEDLAGKYFSNNRILRCKICGRSFLDIAPFVRHKVLHVKENGCLVCRHYFTMRNKVKMYKHIHKWRKRKYGCVDCRSSYKIGVFLNKFAIYHQKSKSLTSNKFSDSKSSSVDQVVKRNNSANSQEAMKLSGHNKYRYNARGAELSLSSGSKTESDHCETKDFGNAMQHPVSEDLVDIDEEEDVVPAEGYLCDMCGEPFDQFAEFQMHKLFHSEAWIDEPDDERSSSDIDKDMSRIGRELPRTGDGCSSFPRDFAELDGLPSVVTRTEDMIKTEEYYYDDPTENSGVFQIMVGGRKYECDICGMQFALRFTLKKHRVGHLKEQKFQCLEIGESPESPGELKVFDIIYMEETECSVSDVNVEIHVVNNEGRRNLHQYMSNSKYQIVPPYDDWEIEVEDKGSASYNSSWEVPYENENIGIKGPLTRWYGNTGCG